MTTDGVPKKPPRVYLYECAFVISCDEFIVMPACKYNGSIRGVHVIQYFVNSQLTLLFQVSTNDMTSTSNIPSLCSDKKSLYLPSDMPTLQFDYTLYFYPGQEDAKGNLHSLIIPEEISQSYFFIFVP
jgi:hypothetical protein